MMHRNTKINGLLLLVVAALAVLPLALGLGDHKEEPFSGSDGEAESAITELQPDYEPWFSPLYEPPSGEIESALFALQAAIGAGVLAYYFGLRRGRRQGEARARAGVSAPVEDPALHSARADGVAADGGTADRDGRAPSPSGTGRTALRGTPEAGSSGAGASSPDGPGA
ncbi:energy-coupling factor ABC transporter substrate-binding protein [Streptomyces sp. NPDC058872]|uniref:energy-coupling factor ABC transporter substrate-binding protein n=1 Tax=Streptomyces sp. NPDC058872 TaxID=3346661 RepID=UPI0036BF63D6